MKFVEIAYLGPKGSFASLVAQKRHPAARLTPLPSISEVVEYVQQKKNRLGIVPIENSSAGIILETIDAFMSPSFHLVIQEELGIHVRLAFLGRKNREIKAIYSHFAPLHHCENWIKRNHPHAEARRVSSTSEAVRIVAREQNSAALATRDAAALYKLDVLEFPVEKHIVNVTQFFTIGHRPSERNNTETSLLISLKNKCGSLCEFLKPFAREKVNLKRIVSRNVIGHPNTYVFFIGVEASERDRAVQRALEKARRHAVDIRMLGSYPTKKPYLS